MKAVGELIELGEPGRHSDHLAATALGRLDLVDRGRDGVGEGNEVLDLDSTGYAIDLSLGVVDEVDDLALARVAHLHDAGSGLDKATQHGLLGDDRRVEAGVGRRWHERRQRMEVLRTTGSR